MTAEQKQNKKAAIIASEQIVQLIGAAIALRNGSRTEAVATLKAARLALTVALEVLGE